MFISQQDIDDLYDNEPNCLNCNDNGCDYCEDEHNSQESHTAEGYDADPLRELLIGE